MRITSIYLRRYTKCMHRFFVATIIWVTSALPSVVRVLCCAFVGRLLFCVGRDCRHLHATFAQRTMHVIRIIIGGPWRLISVSPASVTASESDRKQRQHFGREQNVDNLIDDAGRATSGRRTWFIAWRDRNGDDCFRDIPRRASHLPVKSLRGVRTRPVHHCKFVIVQLSHW